MPRIVALPPEDGVARDGARVAGWWEESADGRRLLCKLCPRGCSLAPGDRGFCFVRENRDGQLISSTYGRSTGFCIDPIEKKPLNHFYPGSSVLSFGTAGCNLGCKFCQNWTTTKSRSVEGACEWAAPEAIAEAAARLDCRSVAFTYNDPIVWAEYAIDTAKACRQRGIRTVAVTSGYMLPGPREAFYQHIDAANVDLKGFSDEFYRTFTGGRLEPVLDTLRWIARQSHVWLEITNLVIPQANDSPDEIQRMCRWIVDELGPDVPLHFSAFHPDFELVDRGATPRETLIAAHDIARQAGLRHVFTGNVVDPSRQATYCPGCGKTLIGRDGYQLREYAIRAGCCAHCGAKVAGHFDDAPGDWGGHRQPIRIADYSKRPATRKQPEPSPAEARQCDAATPTLLPGSVERPLLTDQQQQQVFRAAGLQVAATVRSQTMAESLDTLLGSVAATPLYGAFVSLKRGGQLRSCCGFLGQTVPLWEAVDHAAIRAAKDDPRFPAISATELEHLDMEVWLLWGLQPVTARGQDRAGAIVIGRHGVQIARGSARGLLLPGVAVEHHLDAKQFLEQVCLKAGLPTNAWTRDDTQLMTFEGYAIRGPLANAGLGHASEPASTGPTAAQLASLAAFCRDNLLAMVQGATPSFYMSGGFDGGVNGVTLTIELPGADQKIECNQISLRPDMPLQSTLHRLTEAAANVLRARPLAAGVLQTLPVGLSVLTDPSLHGTAEQPKLEGLDPRHRAVLVAHASGFAWVYDPQQDARGLLDKAMAAAGSPAPERTQVFSLAAVSTQSQMTVVQSTRSSSPGEVRLAAVAGAFYPGSASEIHRMLGQMFAETGTTPPESWPAAMVPHAGWIYSGRLAAAVLSRLKIPGEIIVLCPKHRPDGADWAVAPHGRWSFPGGEMAADPELARRLAGAITGLELDAHPHRQEHAIEVQLPLLARLAPSARVVGITIGGGNWPRLEQFAHQLADVLRDMPERPLLLISSDMNHFADEAKTRRLDQMALDAIESLDPACVFETIERHHISMCGMRPAVIVMETLRRLGSLHRCQLVGHTTSAETSGDKTRVVGYAGLLLG